MVLDSVVNLIQTRNKEALRRDLERLAPKKILTVMGYKISKKKDGSFRVINIPKNLGFKHEPEWVMSLDRDKTGLPIMKADNLQKIFEKDPVLNHIYFDIYKKLERSGRDCQELLLAKNEEITDTTLTRMETYLENVYGMRVTSGERLVNAQAELANRMKKNPVKEYFESLEWDGVERVDRLLVNIAGANDTPYNRAVTRKSIIGAVARAYEPGCQMDTVLILEGVQGTRKTTLCETLFSVAGGDYTAIIKLALKNKDTQQQMTNLWGVILDEFASFGAADVEELKAFITTKTDSFRTPYSRKPEHFKRACVVWATINPTDGGYLRDVTGNRRFWPIELAGDIDINWLKLNRGQVWAEAVVKYKRGEAWWFTESEEDSNLLLEAIKEQNKRLVVDPIVRTIQLFLVARRAKAAINPAFSKFTIDDIMQSDVVPEKIDRTHTGTRTRIGKWLAHAGVKSKQSWAEGKKHGVFDLTTVDFSSFPDEMLNTLDVTAPLHVPNSSSQSSLKISL